MGEGSPGRGGRGRGGARRESLPPDPSVQLRRCSDPPTPPSKHFYKKEKKTNVLGVSIGQGREAAIFTLTLRLGRAGVKHFSGDKKRTKDREEEKLTSSIQQKLNNSQVFASRRQLRPFST